MESLSVSGLGKAYRVYARRTDALKEWIFRRDYHEAFWAVRDVTFTLPRGASLGIVGENGAGKSTLLQLLAGTIEPSTGHLERYGRLSAILELGSGFHGELTGRENIRLGCAVLGLSPAETNERMPAIVAFSELGDFVDRPVKTYSTGMYMRLAFSVVTSVDPDILVVDEALSVGDQHFQKKSMDRMMAFREAGKTLVFCSHNLYYVKQICDQCLWLRDGQTEMLGPVFDVTEAYEDYERARDGANESSSQLDTSPPQRSGRDAYIRGVDIVGAGDESVLETGGTLMVRIVAHLGPGTRPDAHIGLVIVRNDRIWCYGVSTEIDGAQLHPLGDGDYGAVFVVESLPLLAGEYTISVGLLDENAMHAYDFHKSAAAFKVRQGTREVGMIRFDHRWEKP